MNKWILINVITIAMLLFNIAPQLIAQNNTIVFKNLEHNFGQIKENGGNVSCIFTFKNTGDWPLKLESVLTSTGSLMITQKTTDVMPNNYGTISVEFSPQGKSGLQNKAITITSNGTPNKIYLRIKADVISATSNINPSAMQVADVQISNNETQSKNSSTNQSQSVKIDQTQPSTTKQKDKNEKIASTEQFRVLAKNVKEGNLNEIVKFIENGYSFQPPSDFGYSILVIAVNYLPFRKDIFKYLVDNGADVNYINEDNTTSLSFAINKNNTEAVKMLLESGASPNFREDWTKQNISKGMALLEKAIMSDTDKKAIIKLLIAAGANVNNSTIDNSYGIFTTLGFAIGKALDRVNPDYELIKLLIDAGADVNGKVTLIGGSSATSGTILDYVETKNPNSPIVTILKNAGAKSSNANSTSKKYITIGDITDVFSNNSSNNNKAPENERNVDKQNIESNTASKENTGTSKQDAKDGNVIVPSYTNNNYKSGGNLSLGDFDYSDFNFKDGTSGTLYRGGKTNKYFISVDGISPTYYKSQDYAIKALYIYKKHNEITDAGKE